MKFNHENGKSGKGEIYAVTEAQRPTDIEPCEGEASDDVAENHITLTPRVRQGDYSLLQNRFHVTPLAIPRQERELHTENGFGPHKEIGPTIGTPTQPPQQLGLSPTSNKGSLQNTCKVYLRHRWSKKKNLTAQNPIEDHMGKE